MIRFRCGLHLLIAAVLFCSGVMLTSNVSAADRAKILLIGKRPDHPHGSHMYMHVSKVLAKCLQNNGPIETVVSEGWPEDAKVLEGVKTIVLYSNPGAEFLLDGPGAPAFHELMRSGVGLVTLHWASAVYQKDEPRLGGDWGNYLGGYWVSNVGLSTDKSNLQQLVPEHPICRGWSEYELHDEYYLNPTIKAATPLLQVSTKGQDVVVGWAHQRANNGRAYGTTLGHFYRNFQQEAFRRTLVNAILWTAHLPVPQEGANVDIDPVWLALPPDPKAKPKVSANLRDPNLVAWCIVPFDGKKRDPAQRAKMLDEIGIKRVAYDWRANHVPTFEQEILEYKKYGIEYFAFWGQHDAAFELFKKHDLHPQIWQTAPSPPADSQQQRVAKAASQLLPLVKRTASMGCKLGLYNHGGWGGEPENLIAVCQYLRQQHDADHVGIVYNLHHGHGHLNRFAQALAAMKPFLHCLNLNGMETDGDKHGKKILPLGVGTHDVKLIQTISASGYQGPIGIIGHTQDDVRERLQDNLDGLHWILPQLQGKPAAKKPQPRTYDAAAFAEPTPTYVNAPDEPAAANKVVQDYSADLVQQLVKEAQQQGNAVNGLVAFTDQRLACASCHKIGQHGGSIGPDLSTIAGKRTPAELVESIYWPARHIEPQYQAVAVLDDEGKLVQGYVVRETDQAITLRDISQPQSEPISIDQDRIEYVRKMGSLMPKNLVASMSHREQLDLLRFLFSLGRDNTIESAVIDGAMKSAQSHDHGPVEFPITQQPLQPELWPNWQHAVNRDRIYDFYAKQADHFRSAPRKPKLISSYPGLDGGKQGHWGNQNDNVWADDRWSETDLGSLLGGVFRGAGPAVTRGYCFRDASRFSACFDIDRLRYTAVWKKGFVALSDRRHGFMGGLTLQGALDPATTKSVAEIPASMLQDAETPPLYQGLYRSGSKVVFAYSVDGNPYLSSLINRQGTLHRVDQPAKQSSLAKLVANPVPQWPQTFQTEITFGDQDGEGGQAYVVDAIALPKDNPWNALMFISAQAFLPDGSALVCTMQGDVWHVTDFQYPSRHATWRRFAAGLHQPLGMWIDEDGIFVQCRDQIMRLHDRNQDGEADYYECFSKCFVSSAGGHDYICGLHRDAEGYFYTASGNQGLLKISPDGRSAKVIATGFRNPDGLGLTPDGMATVPCSEGGWTPASMVCGVPTADRDTPLHYGYRGPVNDRAPEVPLVYLPRGIDNSAGGQVFVDSDKWGPVQGQLIHTSFGTGTHALVLRDQVGDQWQGAVVPLAGDFLSGTHRARFHPVDGQLYVSGMQGWGTYTPDDGCFQRVRYTGQNVQLPVGFKVHQNGVAIRFSQPIDKQVAEQVGNHFAQVWNYRYSSAYGSPEFSPSQPSIPGHDLWLIKSAHVVDDGLTLFLEIPQLQPVNQLHLLLQVSAEQQREVFVTVNALDQPRREIPGVESASKHVQPHPMQRDMAMLKHVQVNPFAKKIKGARAVEIATADNLTYATPLFEVQAGEAVALTLVNPDVVPHNIAIVKPGALEDVGRQSDRLISDPNAAFRHYVPDSPSVIAYTDVVTPKQRFTIYFKAPKRPGRYPFLCTFPGHWKVMNGVMVVK